MFLNCGEICKKFLANYIQQEIVHVFKVNQIWKDSPLRRVVSRVAKGNIEQKGRKDEEEAYRPLA